MTERPTSIDPEAKPTLARVVVGVPDPDATIAWLADGLDFTIVQRDGVTLAVTAGDYGPNGQGALEIHHAETLTLKNFVFSIPAEFNPESLATALDGQRTEEGGVQLVDPSGIPFLVQPAAPLAVEKPAFSAVRPRRLGHVNAKSTNPVESVEFYRRAFGMVLSEQLGEDLFWARSYTEHHNIGLRRGAVSAIHHLGFEVDDFAAYAPILNHLDAAGYKAEYGPGRHRPGASYFTYVVDPSSGLRIELFADMAHIVTGPSTPPKIWKPEDRFTQTLNIWGPQPPQSFLE